MIITHIIPHLVIGGAQTALRTLIDNLPECKHRIWTLDSQREKSWEHFDVTQISIIQLLKNLSVPASKNSVFHFHWYPPFKFKIPETNKRCVVTIQENEPCTILGSQNYIISTSLAQKYVPVGATTHIIPPGVNIKKWRNLNLPRKKGMLIRHSTIYPEKLSTLMLEDMKRYQSDRFTWKVIGVGEPEYVNDLKRNAPSIEINAYEDICLQLNEAWLYVYHAPTNYENFGLCFMEAMACGLPVITNDIKGGKMQIENLFNGFVCKDYEEMKLKVEFLYHHPEVYDKLVENISSINFVKKERDYASSYSALYQGIDNAL